MSTKQIKKQVELLYFILSTVTLLAFYPTSIVATPLFFNRYSTQNGLSNNCVYAILQDRYGFLWAGTTDGLNRFDGVTYKTFYKQELGVNSSYIISLCEDNQGNIYIGTDNGVSVYNREKDIFQRIEKIANTKLKIRNKVSVIKQDDEGKIWMTVDKQGLFSFNPATGKLKNYLTINGIYPSVSGVSYFYFAKNKPGLISYYFENLYVTDKTFKHITPFTLSDGSQPYKRDNILRIIKGTNDNTIYVASVNRGVCEINLSQNTIRTVCPDYNEKVTPNDLYLDQNNILWIATNNGLYQYNTRTEQLNHLELLDDKLLSLSDLEVMTLIIDDIKGIWLGSFNHGLLHNNNEFIRFEKFFQTPSVSLIGKIVREFEEDKNNIIWMGTRRSGLFTYDPKKNQLERYRNNELPETIFGLCRDNDNLWLGSYDGIYLLNIKTGAVKIYNRRNKNSKVRDNRTTKIYKNSQNQILVGTALGLLQYDATKDDFISIDTFKGIFVDDIIEDRKGNMWYATYANGLYKKDRMSGKFINYKNNPDDSSSIPCNKVISLFEDNKQHIWITTFGGGLCRLNNDETFTTFDISNGLPSNIIYKIIEDNTGIFWISSQKGLIKFKPETKEIKVYTTADGLLNDEFNFLSGIKTDDGSIIFGSQDGFIRFNPKDFVSNPKVPKIVITDLLINNQMMKADEKNSPLKCGINQTNKVELTATQNNLQFKFSILNFHSPLNNKLYYKLDGFDKEWQKMSSQHSISYNNLPSGKYILYVKGVSSDGVWNKSFHPIRIIVKPKFYKSTIAIILYFAVIVFLLAFTFYYLRKRTIIKHRKQQKIYEKNKEIELYNEKMDFLSNIAHEIKTPLTLIRTPIENIIKTSENLDREINDDLNLINYNALHLSKLINEFLDFSKIGKKGFKLSCIELDIVEKIKFLKYNFHNIAESKHINISLTNSDEHIFVFADEQQIVKIFNNLFNNALKYAKNYISIHIQSKENQVVISVKNDGVIIPLDKRKSIFETFIQFQDPEKIYMEGFGLGLSLSQKFAELHSGSLVMDDDLTSNNFILTLPLLRTSQEKEEIVTHETSALETNEDGRPVVLFVEDNIDLLSYIERKLSKHYKILTATNGEIALNIINNKLVDIIVSDISMPQMDGLEMCKELKKNFETSHIPIIVLSAHTSMQSKIICIEQGIDIYIEKPFSMEFLVSSINGQLNKRKTLINLYKSIVNPSPNESNLSERDKGFLIELDEIVIKNMGDPDFSNEQLAELLFLSKSTLNRKFKGLLNTTPNEYIRTKRLIMAAKLLTEGSLRINETCYQVGFGTPSYFIKCFKNFYGKLPTEYIEYMKHADKDHD